MSADARAVTLVNLFQMELPAGNVNLCDGGFVDFDTGSGIERFEAIHPVYGTLATVDSIEQGFRGTAESGTIALNPNPALDVTDWFTIELRDARVRFWFGEVGSDFKTVTSAELLHDWLVDVPSRVISAEGAETLELALMSRDQRYFLVNEGNVCSERSHKRFWPGENGFNNCTDTPTPVPWGVAAPPNGTRSGGSGGGGFGGRVVDGIRRAAN